MIIYLVLLLPAGSSDLPKAWRAAFISLLFGLASNGVYMCHCCYQQCGSLLHCLSTLTIAFAMAVYFCCTGLGVASTGRYPASCPAKPGLSSSAAFRRMQPRLSVLLNTVLHYTMSDSECQTPVLLSESLGFCFYILLYTVREKACQTLHRIPRNASGTHFSCLYDA